MSDLITSQMLSDWRANYGLDKRTPIKAMHWWQDNMDGKAPAGVVAALGLCINEIERLTAEVERQQQVIVEMGEKLRGIVNLIRGELPEDESHSTHDAVDLVRGLVMHSDLYAAAVAHERSALTAERDDLRRQLAEAEQDAWRYRWLRGEHKRVDPICAVIWKRNGDRNGSEWVNTANIDAEIDAAMGASNE